MVYSDLVRIDELTQLKISIRGSTEHLIVGIDVGKDTHHTFYGTATGRMLLKRLVIGNDRAGFDKLVAKTNDLKVKHDLSRVVFGMEPTANYHKPLGEFLIDGGCDTVLVSNVAVKRNRELLDGRWDKHDTKDAANVADLVSQGKCLYYDRPSEAIGELQSLLLLKRKLKKQNHSQKMRIRNHLVARYFPELDAFFESSMEEECLAIVKHVLNPKEISRMEFPRFFQMVTRRRKSSLQKSKLEKIWNTASDSIGCRVDNTIDFEARTLVESLEQIRGHIVQTEKRILRICEPFPEYQSLLSIPGFGPVISPMTLGAIGNPHRFRNSRQVLKLVGLDLSASRSGKSSSNAIASISKKGKSELRYALYQAAVIASSRNKLFAKYFTLKMEERSR